MRNGYGLGEIIKNMTSLAYTKIFYPRARLIRRPVYTRGKKLMEYGKGLTTGYHCRIEMFRLNGTNEKKLIIGANCKLGDYVHIAAGESIIIGRNCLLASKIYISDITHGDYSDSPSASSPYEAPDKRILKTAPVKIGDNVWIGDNVCVLPGVSIGDGCVIGANSVVNRDIPNNCIAVGAPARVVKRYDEELKMWVSIKWTK